MNELEAEIIGRVSKLEANEETIFHQLTDIKLENKALQELAKSVAIIATKTDQTADSVKKIDGRLSNLEKVPAENVRDWKKAIISTVVSVVAGGILGALLALIIK